MAAHVCFYIHKEPVVTRVRVSHLIFNRSLMLQTHLAHFAYVWTLQSHRWARCLLPQATPRLVMSAAAEYCRCSYRAGNHAPA
jgi:hypothetical protein